MNAQLLFDGISESLRQKDHLGTKFHNCYRAMRFTKKGQKIGNDPDWDTFSNFHRDMMPSYIDGYHLLRVDKERPFSKDNCFWGNSQILTLSRQNTVLLELNGETLSLREWSVKSDRPYNGIRKRFYAKGYTPEEIVYGRKYKKRIWNKEDSLRIRASKLLASYRVRDFKKQQEFKISKEWFIENILLKPCYYCGASERIGADRKDNSLGHTEENCLPCCHICNGVRGDRFSVGEMSLIGKVIRQIKIKRN